MAGGGEANDVGADFRDDDLSGEVTDAGDGPQLADRLAERVEIAVHLRIDLGDGRVECINVAQMQAQARSGARSETRPCSAADTAPAAPLRRAAPG